jgi:asparagine synthetase B (glutamine-hydrolysing)
LILVVMNPRFIGSSVAPVHGDHFTTEPHRMVRTFWQTDTRTLANRLEDLPGNLSLDREALDTFLLVGSVPGSRTLFEGVECLRGGYDFGLDESGLTLRSMSQYAKKNLENLSLSQLRERGAHLLRRAADRAYQSGANILLPLSGGLDSRTLLALLMERRNPSEIQTYTYGIPGTLDFEIGNRVAARAGTRHTTIDLRAMEFTVDRLVQTAKWSDANTNLFQPYVWTEVARRFGTEMTIWSGYTGDGLAGSFFQEEKGLGTDQAVQRYLDFESRTLTWHSTPEAQRRARDTAASMVATKTKYDHVLSRPEAIWFANHPERYTTHQVFMNRLTYRCPFMDDDVATFLLNLGPDHRKKRFFFDHFVSSVWPELFRHPTRCSGYRLSRARWSPVRNVAWLANRTLRKAGHRLDPVRVTHPETAYLDFRVALTDSAEVRSVARELVHSLAERGILDRRRILDSWDEHQRHRSQTSLIPTLASLEAIIRAFDVRDASEGPG